MNHKLIPDTEAKALSRRLANLGDQVEAIEEDLASRGYGKPAAVKRGLIEEFAMNTAEHQSLHLYWRECAKERLASLAGPVNIPRGRYPPICEYRSAFIAQLRDEAPKGLDRSEGSSPQIEPTYKRFVERKRTPQQLREMVTAINNARVHAASTLGMAESAEFTNFIRLLQRAKVAETVAARFFANMKPDGFAIESNPMKGLVCRKSMPGCGLDFVLMFQFTDALLAGVLYPMFALVLPAQDIAPGETHRFAVASFSPEVLVPEFYEACAFSPESHAQMCLAVDSITYLCSNAYGRILKVLCDAGGVSTGSRDLRGTVESGFVGGLAARVVGGKFTDGFSVAAAGYLLNNAGPKSAASKRADMASAALNAVAAATDGDTTYTTESDSKWPAGYKCNKFVFDMGEAAGIDMPTINGVPIKAYQWAYGDAAVAAAGFERVYDPQPGDIIASALGTEGHVGIIVAPGMTVSAASTSLLDGVTENDWGFRAPLDVPTILKTYWRYTGTPQINWGK